MRLVRTHWEVRRSVRGTSKLKQEGEDYEAEAEARLFAMQLALLLDGATWDGRNAGIHVVRVETHESEPEHFDPIKVREGLTRRAD